MLALDWESGTVSQVLRMAEREQQQQCQVQEAEGAVERADKPEGSSKELVFLNNAGRIIVKKWK